MSGLTFLDDVEVYLQDSMGDDGSIVQAARVSVSGENWVGTVDPEDEQAKKDIGLINYLLREKHGSPFEHNSLTFFVKAPIFVFREFHRHRIGFSYNEMSGRYTELPPEFYLPNHERPLRNIGTSARPEFAAGTTVQVDLVESAVTDLYEHAWFEYKRMLDAGVANEVARIVLPVGIMSQMYVTTNARAIMHFLALRTRDERASHASRPQLEIEMVAQKIEGAFAELFPVTYAAFNKYGRVAP